MTFEWKHIEHRSGGWGSCNAYPFFARVQDCDGDCTIWAVTHHKKQIASGTVYPSETEHPDGDYGDAIERCEQVLRGAVGGEIYRLEKRLTELRGFVANPHTEKEA